MTELFYCEKWLFAEKRPLKSLDPRRAKQRHDARKPYAAVVGMPMPTHIVSLAGSWVTVSFLDSLGRQELTYDFNERRPSELFLTMAVSREFVGDEVEAAIAKIFAFEEDGSILIEERIAQREARQLRASSDASPNWDVYPAFGEYAHLCNRERVQARR